MSLIITRTIKKSVVTLMAFGISCAALSQCSITPSYVVICEGASVTLIAGGGVSYQWNDGSTSASITTAVAGTYTVTAGGCSATATVVLGISPEPTIMQNGDTLSTQTYTAYQWLLNDSIISGATSQSYIPTQDGDYSVIVTTDGIGCIGTSTPLSVAHSAGINAIADTSFQIYPNPNNGVFTVEMPVLMAPINAKVINALGQTVYSSKINSAKTSVDLSGLPAGVYVLSLHLGGQIVTRNIIVNKTL